MKLHKPFIFVKKSKTMLLSSGVKGSSSYEAVGFFRSSSQPDNDPRPYMQTCLASTLIGNEPSVHDTFRKWFNFNKKVRLCFIFK